MGFYNCIFILKPEEVKPEFYDFRTKSISPWEMVKSLFNREERMRIDKVMYNTLGNKFQKYYNMLYTNEFIVKTEEEIAEAFNKYTMDNPDKDISIEDFCVEVLECDYKNGQGVRDYIVQEEKENGEGRFDSFSVMFDFPFTLMNGKMVSVANINEINFQQTLENFISEPIDFFVDKQNRLIEFFDKNEVDTMAYLQNLEPNDMVVMTRLHD